MKIATEYIIATQLYKYNSKPFSYVRRYGRPLLIITCTANEYAEVSSVYEWTTSSWSWKMNLVINTATPKHKNKKMEKKKSEQRG